MIDQALISYVKENLAAGFPENEIRDGLRKVGWREEEIEEGFLNAGGRPVSPLPQVPQIEDGPAETEPGFFAKRKKTLLVALIIAVAAPILAFAGVMTYQKFIKTEAPLPETEQAAAPQETAPSNAEKKSIEQQARTQRDRQRLEDIAQIQSALSEYFTANSFYPKKLADLSLVAVPADPKNHTDYLYNPLGEPALNYSLAFVLEEDVGMLKAGLQAVSSENKLEAAETTRQDQLVKGEITPEKISSEIEITDLSKLPFYPGEEVTLEAKTALELQAVLLIMDNLNLTDKKNPFTFTFSAPGNPGEYPVKIFGFTREGENYYQFTKLIVTERR